ncbi:hypothetical protein FQN54_005475 [Arachnomyces sp. PD_36]|nr:hypothetical protein FQN54_005475 [Arachnomyces sp. PD_36]
MTDALPKGLIVKTEGTNSNIERLNGVDVADIAQLWKVYTTNSNFVGDESGVRLENFFWRIWSSRRIYQSIQGPTLARLFAQISDGSSSIRTTPVASPPKPSASRRKGAELVTPLASLGDSPSNAILPSPPLANTGSRSTSGTITEGARTPSDAARAPLPPPILKKGRADSDDPPKTTRIVVPEPERAPVTRPPPPQRRESEKIAPNQGRKKTLFVATAANSKRRPVLPRRKSSRSPSSATTSAKQSPVLTPQNGTPPIQEEPLNLPKSGLASGIAISSNNLANSSGSWQDTSSLLSSRFPSSMKPTTTTTKSLSPNKSKKDPPSSTCDSQSPQGQQQQPTNSLVEKDFRARFAEKKIRELGLSPSPSSSSMMPPPPLPASKKGDAAAPSSRPTTTQTPRSASTPIYASPPQQQQQQQQSETSSSSTATAPVSAAPRKGVMNINGSMTSSPSMSSRSQSQLSSMIEADRRKKMAGS